MKHFYWLLFCGLLATAILPIQRLNAATSVQAEPIKIGMSAAFSGRAERLGTDFRAGAELVFAQINHAGGIAGRPIQLVSFDDGYEPLQTVANTRQLIFEHQVLALFGYIGTPTSHAVLPLLRRMQIPFIAPLSGADILRQAEDGFIYNFRASYAQEADAQIRYLVDERQFRKIGLLIQADEFGASVERNFLSELQKRQLTPVVISRFQRNSHDLAAAVNKLVAHRPDVVLTVGTYQMIFDAIQLGAAQKFQPVYSVVSFTGVSKLTSLLAQQPQHQVLASMVMPDPEQSTLSLVQAYQQQLRVQRGLTASASDTTLFNDVALEGFAAATILVQALQSCAQTLTRACLMQALPQQPLYDFKLDYRPARHQASQQIFLVWLKQQRLQPIAHAYAELPHRD